MAFACTVEPMPNVAMAVKKAKAYAISFQKRRAVPVFPFAKPRSSAYIGPPSVVPFFVVMRYFTASSASPYFVDIPSTPVSQHQNTAPGPPRATAVPTPTMLPVPMVAARAVARAANCDTSPCESLSLPTDRRIAFRM